MLSAEEFSLQELFDCILGVRLLGIWSFHHLWITELMLLCEVSSQ